MSGTRKNQRKALVALALGFATAAIFATTASAGLGTGPIPGQYSADLEAEQAMIQAPSFSRITSAADLYAGQLEPAQSNEISYLSWGATADDLGPFKPQKAISYLSWGATGDDRGPFVVQRVETPYLSWGATAADLSPFTQQNLSGEGVTPTNLARADRGGSDAAVPAFESKTVESATVSASSGSVDRSDLALGFGLGLILATACAIALAMTRDRQHNRMAHS